jgi:hypothetical protein
MNFVFNSIEDLEVENISFLDTKKNNIIDGNFTKIIYNDEFTTLNGIFIYVSPLFFEDIQKIEHLPEYSREEEKYFLYERIDTSDDTYKEDYDSDNNDTVLLQSEKELFLNLEYNILNLYKKIFNIKKKMNLTLKSQTLNNSFKIYKGTFIKHTKKTFHSSETDKQREEVALLPNETSIVLKISGIWENEFEIGITFKFFEMKHEKLKNH